MQEIIQNNQKKIRYREPFLQKEYAGFYYIYYFDYTQNKRRKVSTHVKIQSKAIQALKKFKSTYIRNQSQISINSISELRDTILRCFANIFAASNLALYKMSLNDLIKVISDKPLRLICYLDIENFMNERVKRVSINATNTEFRTIKAAFNIAKRLGEIDENPTDGVKQFKPEKRKNLCFSSEEIFLLLNVMGKHFIKDVTLLVLYAGFRRGELENLRWCNVDFDNKIIYIKNQENWSTKTKKERDIPISEELNTVLQNLIVSNRQSNLVNFHKPEDYVFRKSNGEKYSGSHISRIFKKLLRKAGLDERFHFHCLRHTFITNLIKNGVNINYVKELAGHACIQTTMDYIHIVTEDLRNAVNTINLNKTDY